MNTIIVNGQIETIHPASRRQGKSPLMRQQHVELLPGISAAAHPAVMRYHGLSFYRRASRSRSLLLADQVLLQLEAGSPRCRLFRRRALISIREASGVSFPFVLAIVGMTKLELSISRADRRGERGKSVMDPIKDCSQGETMCFTASFWSSSPLASANVREAVTFPLLIC